MSNIFEIDGEIEDNMDENGGKKKNSENEPAEEKEANQNTESTELDNESEAEADDLNPESDSTDEEEEEPWFNKYLPEEERVHTPHHHYTHEETPTEIDKTDEIIGAKSGNLNEAHENQAAESVAPEEDVLPTVDDITDEEIEEVLAELETVNNEFDGNEEVYSSSYEEDDYEDDEEVLAPLNKTPKKEETFDEIFPRTGHAKSAGGLSSWIFLTLFLISFSLLVYYQFYDGHSLNLSFAHKSSAGISRIDSIGNEFKSQLETLENQQKIITQLRDKIKELHEKNHELLSDSAKTVSTPIASSTGEAAKTSVNINSGTFYQVQVIALQEYHPDFGDSDFNFYVDKENGFSKMLIGALKSESEAKVLYEKVRKSGFDDAFIVKKVNGKRVEYNPFE